MFYQLSHFGTPDYFKREDGEDFSFPTHLHQSFELILVKDGSMDVIIDEKVYALKKNQAVIIFPNQIHSLSSKSSKHTLFLFAPQIVSLYWTEKKGTVPLNNIVPLDEYTVRTLMKLSSESTKFEIKGALYSVCASFDKAATYSKTTSDKQTLIFKILSFIEQNFKEACLLCELAKNVGYNKDYISRYFNEKMNISYNQYLNLRRLNYAAYLLCNTDHNILTCAFESGYTSVRTFNRNFKLYYGLTPEEYKKQKNSGTENLMSIGT